MDFDTTCLLVFVDADGLCHSGAGDLRAVAVDVHLVLDMLNLVGAVNIFLDDWNYLHGVSND